MISKIEGERISSEVQAPNAPVYKGGERTIGNTCLNRHSRFLARNVWNLFGEKSTDAVRVFEGSYPRRSLSRFPLESHAPPRELYSSRGGGCGEGGQKTKTRERVRPCAQIVLPCVFFFLFFSLFFFLFLFPYAYVSMCMCMCVYVRVCPVYGTARQCVYIELLFFFSFACFYTA